MSQISHQNVVSFISAARESQSSVGVQVFRIMDNSNAFFMEDFIPQGLAAARCNDEEAEFHSPQNFLPTKEVLEEIKKKSRPGMHGILIIDEENASFLEDEYPMDYPCAQAFYNFDFIFEKVLRR